MHISIGVDEYILFDTHMSLFVYQPNASCLI